MSVGERVYIRIRVPESPFTHPPVDQRMEHEPRPFVWTKTADNIFDTLAAYCPRVSNSEDA